MIVVSNGTFCHFILLVMFFAGTSSVQADDATLNNLRLFYTEVERQSTTSQGGDMPHGDKPLLDVAATTASPPVFVPHPNPTTVKAQVLGVSFTALLEGRQIVQVLINGLPCKAISLGSLSVASEGVPIECPMAIPGRFDLLFVAEREQVWIVKGKMIKARLQVGDSA